MDTFARKRHLPEVLLLLAVALPAVGLEEENSPRTPWGAPDLNGVWRYSIGTPLERPDALADKTHFTEQEAAAYLEGGNDRLEDLFRFMHGGDETFVGVDLWIESDLPLTEDRRTSLIYEPSNGKIPTLTEAAKMRMEAARVAQLSPPAGPEDRPPAERCIIGAISGPPMFTGVDYNSNVQIIQSEKTIVLVNEMINDSRIIPLDNRPPLPENIRQWRGDSRGYWDGDTLVVETRNFTDQTSFSGSGMNLQLRERFTRVSDEVIEYDYRVSDPESFTSEWAARSPMILSDQPIYEYACHEHNRSMQGMLSGARVQEADAMK
jgi:hypothetical protein